MFGGGAPRSIPTPFETPMPIARHLVLPFALASFAFVAAAPQDAAVALKRSFPGQGKTLTFKATHAESYVVDGDPQGSRKYHGDAAFSVVAADAAEAGTTSLKPSYGKFTSNWFDLVDKEPILGHAVDGATKAEFPAARTTVGKERVVGAPNGYPNSFAGAWFDAKEALAQRLAASVSAGDGEWATQTRLNFAFPPLPAEAVKQGARYDADFVAGYLGQEAQVQVFYANVVEAVGEKTVTLSQSGRAKLVKFEKPTSRRGDAWTFDVVEDASTFSAKVEIDRADGAVVKREGELTVVFKATDPAAPTAPKTVTAKIWTKLERQ
jgi:hypothetical protein